MLCAITSVNGLGLKSLFSQYAADFNEEFGNSGHKALSCPCTEVVNIEYNFYLKCINKVLRQGCTFWKNTSCNIIKVILKS